MVVMAVVVSHSTVVMVGMRVVSSQLGAILGPADSRRLRDGSGVSNPDRLWFPAVWCF